MEASGALLEASDLDKPDALKWKDGSIMTPADLETLLGASGTAGADAANPARDEADEAASDDELGVEGTMETPEQEPTGPEAPT